MRVKWDIWKYLGHNEKRFDLTEKQTMKKEKKNEKREQTVLLEAVVKISHVTSWRYNFLSLNLIIFKLENIRFASFDSSDD